MEILGAIGIAGRELWNYNRELFKYDQDQRLERDLAALEMKVKQFELYREDIRDLVELTVGRMDIYHLVGAMLLEFTVVFYCEGRIHAIAPPWILMMFFGCLSSAFVFLILAVWLSMHASVSSHSFGVRLLTRFVRLPIPTATTLNQARTKFAQFEKSGFANMFRLPFIEPSQTWDGDIKAAGAADQTGQQDPLSTNIGSSAEDQAPATTSLLEVGQAMLPLGHVELYRRLQARWQCYDAYSRVCMSLGVNQIIHAVCVFIATHMIVEQFAPFAVLLTVIPLEVCNLLLLNLDIREAQHWEFVIGLICTFAPVLLATVALILDKESDDKALVMVISEFLSVAAFAFYAIWYAVVKRFAIPEEVNGLALPFRFRSVLYLDVFGDVLPKSAKTRATNEQKEEILAALEKACEIQTTPLEAMQDLQSAAVRGVEFLDTHAKDVKVENAVTKAAVFFEEQKFRMEEEEVRIWLQRWRSSKVESSLSTSMQEELNVLAKNVRESMDIVRKLTTRRAKHLTSDEEFHYNSVEKELSHAGRCSTFEDFKLSVKNLHEMATEFELTFARFQSGLTEADSASPLLPVTASGQSYLSARSKAGQECDAPKPIIEMHDMSQIDPKFRVVSEDLEKDQSFFPAKADSTVEESNPLRRRVTFFGAAVSAFGYNRSPAGEDFDSHMVAESFGSPETLPWGSVRVMLNVLLLSWVACCLLTLGNAIKPGSPIWGMGRKEHEGVEFMSLHAEWPTPHFEVDRLHCMGQVYVENPYGSMWNVAQWKESNSSIERAFPGSEASAISTYDNNTMAARAGPRILIYLSLGEPLNTSTARPAYALPIGGDDVKFVAPFRLAVLGNNMLSVWDLKTGEQLDGWKVDSDSKAFCHTSNHLYIGTDRGLHRAPVPYGWLMKPEHVSTITE